MTEAKHTTRTPQRLSIDRINPLIDPASPLETMSRVALVLDALIDRFEPGEEDARLEWGEVLVLQCAVAALELAGDIGFHDGRLPELSTVEE